MLDRIRMRMGWDTDAVLHRHIARRITTAARGAINSHGIEVLVMEETQGWAGIVARAVDIRSWSRCTVRVGSTGHFS